VYAFPRTIVVVIVRISGQWGKIRVPTTKLNLGHTHGPHSPEIMTVLPATIRVAKLYPAENRDCLYAALIASIILRAISIFGAVASEE
jgi:hypothetical protein